MNYLIVARGCQQMREIADLYKDEEERKKCQNATARFRLPFGDPYIP